MANKKGRRVSTPLKRHHRRLAQQQNQEQTEVNDLQVPPTVTADSQSSTSLGPRIAVENPGSPVSSIVTESPRVRMPINRSHRSGTALGNPIHGISFIAEDDSDSTNTNTANNSPSNGQTNRHNAIPGLLAQDNSGAPSQQISASVPNYLHPNFIATALENLPASNLSAAMDPAQQNLSRTPKEEKDKREANTSSEASQNAVTANMEDTRIAPEAVATKPTDEGASQTATNADMENTATAPEAEVPKAADDGAEPPKTGYSFKFSDAEATDVNFLATEVIETVSEQSTKQKANGKGKGKAKGKGKQKAVTDNSSDNAELVASTEKLAIDKAESSPADDEKQRKIAEFKETMFRALDQGDARLWENNAGWDVLIHCRGSSWRVHRNTLCEQSPEWMAKYIPPVKKGTTHTVWTLDSHEPRVLGTVLHFMYMQEFEHGEMDPDFPLETGVIVTNVAMFIAGASVLCREMMDLALDNIEAASEIVENIAPTMAHVDIDSFQEPVHRALLIMYEQPDQWLVRSLRLQMARFVATFYGFMVLNQNWLSRYKASWSDVDGFIMHDNLVFGNSASLRPLPPSQHELLRAAQMQAYNRSQAARAASQTPQATRSFQIVQTARGPAVRSATASRGRGRASSTPITTPTPAVSLGNAYNMNTATGLIESEAEASSGQAHRD